MVVIILQKSVDLQHGLRPGISVFCTVFSPRFCCVNFILLCFIFILFLRANNIVLNLFLWQNKSISHLDSNYIRNLGKPPGLGTGNAEYFDF